MRNTILRIIYSVLLFCAVFSLLVALNEESGTQTTAELEDPVLPVVSMNTGSTVFNALYGVTTEQDAGKMRAVLTVLSEERSIGIRIRTYGTEVSSVKVQARDITGENLIETVLPELVQEEEDLLSAEVSFQNLVEADTEYLMIIVLETADGQTVRYYTRFMWSEDETVQDEAEEALAFARCFHEATFGDEEYAEYLTYLEPDDDEDSDTYARVTLYSSTEMVSWGDLDPYCVTEPVYTIIDLQDGTYGICGTYYIMTEPDDEEDGQTALYRVEEFYELLRGTDRFYLMDYERTVSQDFDPENPKGEDGALDLGIADEDLQVMQDETEDTTAFVHDGRLFAVQESGNVLIYVFGFDSPGDTGERETNADHEIRILNVEEDGSIDFLVCGYMNSGPHEGGIGIDIYHYSGEHHTIEELVYIPYDGSWEMLEYSLNRVCYYDVEKGYLYLILYDSLYEVDVDSCTVRTAAADLSGRRTVISDEGRLIAYEELENGISTGRIILMNLNGAEETVIEPGEGERAIPLGFIGEDLIYGVMDEEDVVQDSAGLSLEPMAHVYIVDEELNELEDYHRDGYYVTSVEIADNQIILYRVKKAEEEGSSFGNQYETAEEDEIVSSVSAESEILTQTTSTSRYGETVQVLVGDVDVTSLRYLRPQELSYEGSRELIIRTDTSTADTSLSDLSASENSASNSAEETEDAGSDTYMVSGISGAAGHFYVYDCSGLLVQEYLISEAIEEAAASTSGVVIDEKGRYIWKNNMQTRAEIEELTQMEDGAALRSSAEVCLEAVLNYEGIAADVAALLENGMTALEILTQELTDASVYDLSGCDLEQVLYYVSEYTPVYAVTGNDTAVLIVGYGPENVELYDPEAGSVYLLTRDSAEELFLASGSRFICYING